MSELSRRFYELCVRPMLGESFCGQRVTAVSYDAVWGRSVITTEDGKRYTLGVVEKAGDRSATGVGR